jgi:CheY-like chemotaxis protein
MKEVPLLPQDSEAYHDALKHEVRNILGPIQNAVHLIRTSGQDRGRIEDACAIVDRQVGNMARLLDELPEVPRAAQGLVPVHDEGASAVADSAGAVASVRPRRILIVEDLFDAAITMELLLEMMGHQVEIAVDGQSGLDKADRFGPDIILCDIGLPGALSGYDVARRVRRMPRVKDAYLIALTGFGSASDKAEAAQAGFDLHLVKPIDPAALEPMIARIPPRALSA